MANDQSSKLREQMERKFPKYFRRHSPEPHAVFNDDDRVELTPMGELMADAESFLRQLQQRKS